jgi:hypothetical protein
MKKTPKILIGMLGFAIIAMVISNFLLKKEYDKVDKSDTYWTYAKILEQPFKHIKVQGGNLTTIAFEPSMNPSVRVFKMWKGFEDDSVKAFVRNDTLFLTFPENINDPFEKRFMGWNTLVRIFAPELLSVEGNNTNFLIAKFKQKNIRINLSGRSTLEVESYIHEFDNLQINQRDSSKVVFEISPDLKGTEIVAPVSDGFKVTNAVKTDDLSSIIQNNINTKYRLPKSWETMFIGKVSAQISGVSILDVGRAQIKDLQVDIADSSAVIVSGQALKKLTSNTNR